MTLERLVLATANTGKARELCALVAEWGSLEVTSLVDVAPLAMPEETGTTYLDNALLKARAVCAATGLATLADDSGIEVDALGGAPGVRSARYAPSPEAANVKLLAALRDVPPARRTARYRAVVVVAWPSGVTLSAEGVCEGRIAEVARGSGGFGYDPIFVSLDLGKTCGEASVAEKAAVSHRARAIGRSLHSRGIA
jgi:XTP/dITP diphosphohydrolase